MPPEDLRKRLRSRRWRKLLLLFSPLILLITICLMVFIFVRPYLALASEYGLTPSFVWHFLRSSAPSLRQSQDRTNILVLGIPGGNHEGPDLTDTMLIVSFNWVDPGKSAFITLPRDVWSPTLKDKINTAYHYGEKKKKGGGLVLTKSIASEITGLSLHYAFVIDFYKFTTVVDTLGGLNVQVERSFDDYDFPIAGRENDLCGGDPNYRCRYKQIHFDQGREQMTGERALEFVRSRHATDDEGTDYARSDRQQAVLIALKNKLLTKDVLLDISKLKRLITIYTQATDTDLTIPDLLYLGKLLRDKDPRAFNRIRIPAEGKVRKPEDLLIVAPLWEYGGRWVLVPKAKTFIEIQRYLSCQLDQLFCVVGE